MNGCSGNIIFKIEQALVVMLVTSLFQRKLMLHLNVRSVKKKHHIKHIKTFYWYII